MINTILFDLDGTLLGMKNEEFENKYFHFMAMKFREYNKPEELIKIIWDSTNYMVKNSNGISYNNERFFERFNTLIKPEHRDAYYHGFIDFYNKEFDYVKDTTFQMFHMLESVGILKEKGYEIIIATNPLFPEIAVNKRIDWAGLTLSDFKYITNFEACRFCKPSLGFYEEVLNTVNKKPENCLMVGNDMLEDMIAKEIGLVTYLVEDCIIERDTYIKPDFTSKSDDFLGFVKELPAIL